MHFKWNYEPPTSEQTKAADELSAALGLSPILTRILVRRGIYTESEARHFFRPQLNELHDPFLMNDMDVAVNRLNEAMGRKERIMVYGDYDVDGCTAVALVYKFLLQYYSNMSYYIPDRYEEGYGISMKGLEYAKDTGVRVIIGKGGMKENTERACKEFGAIHCVFPAGNAVVAATEVEEIVRAEWRDLGMPETLWNCRVKEFGPLIVSIDPEGNNFFEQQKVEYNKRKDEQIEKISAQVGFIK